MVSSILPTACGTRIFSPYRPPPIKPDKIAAASSHMWRGACITLLTPSLFIVKDEEREYGERREERKKRRQLMEVTCQEKSISKNLLYLKDNIQRSFFHK